MLEQPQVDCPTRHHFADGLYGREMTVPADTIISGRLHSRSQINVISKGAGAIRTEKGWEFFSAPFTFEAPAGAKRLIYALTEIVWTTFLHTHEREPDAIFHSLTCSSEAEYRAQIAGPADKEFDRWPS